MTKKHIALLFILKLIMGGLFYLIYTSHYTKTETSDAHKYFEDAKKLYKCSAGQPVTYFKILTGLYSTNDIVYDCVQKTSFWYQDESSSFTNDSRSIIRFNLLILPLSRGNFFLHIVLICFISFLGLFALYKSLIQYFDNTTLPIIFAIFLIPSVIFWSSGVMKEGLVFFFLGFLIYFFQNLKKHNILKYALPIFICLIGLYAAKFYLLLAIIPGLLYLTWQKIEQKTSTIFKVFFIVIVCAMAAVMVNISQKNEVLDKLAKKQNDFINLAIGGAYLQNNASPFDTIFTVNPANLIDINARGNALVTLKRGTVYHHWLNPGYADTLVENSGQNNYHILEIIAPSGSAISMQRMQPTFKSLLMLMPTAIINVLFRPFIFDIENKLSLIAFAETLLLIMMLLVMILFFKIPSKNTGPIIVFSLLFIFTLFILIGVTTPVLGAVVRYKIPALPFLYIVIFLFTDTNKIESRIKHQLTRFNKRTS